MTDTIKKEVKQTYNSARRLSDIQKKINEDAYMSKGDLRIINNQLSQIPCYGNQFLISTKLWLRKQINKKLMEN